MLAIPSVHKGPRWRFKITVLLSHFASSIGLLNVRLAWKRGP